MIVKWLAVLASIVLLNPCPAIAQGLLGAATQAKDLIFSPHQRRSKPLDACLGASGGSARVVLLIDSLGPRDVDQERGDAFSSFSKEPWRPGADLRRSSSRRTKRIR